MGRGENWVNHDRFKHIVHDAPKLVIHSCLIFASGVADSAFVPPTRARAVNRQMTGSVVDSAIAAFCGAIMEPFAGV